jgi:hypothetical protein
MQRSISIIAAKMSRAQRSSPQSRSVKGAPVYLKSSTKTQWRSLATKSAGSKAKGAEAKSAPSRSRFISKEAEEALNTHSTLYTTDAV